MKKVLIFGNSGSGKSTLAKKLSKLEGLAHLDLDSLAWMENQPLTRRPLVASELEIKNFVSANEAWVIEGCYSDLLLLATPFANELIFMNLPINICIENARQRPWEPHKYPSKKAQDANLDMLIDWIEQYETRDDTFSAKAHKALYDNFAGTKTEIVINQ
ncbi:AAA family ATPase [Glaciecola petra]|uniref:AAA family ATPase n=1 Tax=Glaciecola petra TaxID=3075602 RepID=A0ABU2ZSY4_9ALTE|nr:AAA family ATPase [Aestuariibacter sp. P117]MDT0594532.1 AAA family ATPase [Aestuariibacter sp. P117]